MTVKALINCQKKFGEVWANGQIIPDVLRSQASTASFFSLLISFSFYSFIHLSSPFLISFFIFFLLFSYLFSFSFPFLFFFFFFSFIGIRSIFFLFCFSFSPYSSPSPFLLFLQPFLLPFCSFSAPFLLLSFLSFFLLLLSLFPSSFVPFNCFSLSFMNFVLLLIWQSSPSFASFPHIPFIWAADSKRTMSCRVQNKSVSPSVCPSIGPFICLSSIQPQVMHQSASGSLLQATWKRQTAFLALFLSLARLQPGYGRLQRVCRAHARH